MKTKLILLTLAFAASTCFLNAQDGGKPNPNGQGGPPPGGGGIHLLPRGAKEKLNLTADQQKQISDLEADVKSKMEKILTAEQMDQLKQMRPQGPGQGGGRGQGRPGGGGKQPPPQNN
jgi:Spy/CpxP family protein refolding chaperone